MPTEAAVAGAVSRHTAGDDGVDARGPQVKEAEGGGASRLGEVEDGSDAEMEEGEDDSSEQDEGSGEPIATGRRVSLRITAATHGPLGPSSCTTGTTNFSHHGHHHLPKHPQSMSPLS